MPKQVLKVDNFKGGVNSLSDARDIEDNQFVQNWNAVTDKDGVIRVAGGGEYYLQNLPIDVTNQQAGYGLFATSADVGGELIEGNLNFAFEEGAVAGYASGTPSITLASSPTYNSSTNHDAEHFYKNKTITIYKTADGAAPQGETRRITAYAADTQVATLDSAFSADPLTNGTEFYKIFNWCGDGSTFGDSGSTNYVDKGGTDFPYDDTESYNPDYSDSYFLRTKVSDITDELSKDLGHITYNAKTTGSDFTTDSTDIGATTLKAGIDYTLSFYCKAASRYYGYISNAVHDGSSTNELERVPFVQLYSNTVTDGTNTGLHLSQTQNGILFLSGTDGGSPAYEYADDLTKNYITNGDYETGAFDGGSLGYSDTYDPPTDWLAYDGFAHNTNNVITYSYISGTNYFGAGTNNEGATLNMASGSAFAWENSYWDWSTGDTGLIAPSFVPNCFLYQEITIPDSQWYELFFAYSTSASGMNYAIIDRTNLRNTAVYAAEAKSQSDGDVVLTVDNGSGAASAATDTLLKNKIICKSDGTVLGVCTAVNSNTEIRFAAGTASNIADNDVLYTASYITPWQALQHTGAVTTYKYIGETNTNSIPKPHKFFAPNNSGNDIKITVAFAPQAASTNIRLDGISLKKSFPDLLSMANKSRIGNPYSEDILGWNKYQFNFKIPSEYNDATDWVLNLNGGSFGFQNGATGSVDNQTVYFAGISLTTQTESDNLIFLNSNGANESEIMIYSENTTKWVGSLITFGSGKLAPIYTYINGMLKISDANFKSGNRSKLLYYSNRKKVSYSQQEKGYKIRDNALCTPPNLLVAANQDSAEINERYDALNYLNNVVFSNETDGTEPHQYSDGGAELNWEIRGEGSTYLQRFIWHTTKDEENENDTTQFFNSPGNRLNTATTHVNPFYLLWCGQSSGSGDMTNNDMQSSISGYSGGAVSKVEIYFTYDFSSAYRIGASGTIFTDSNYNYLKNMRHPYFNIFVGKQNGTDIFDSGSVPTDNDKKGLIMGDNAICSMENIQEAELYVDDEVWDKTYDEEHNIQWKNSYFWDWSTIESTKSGRRKSGTKSFKAVATFNEDNAIAITEDILLKFETIYPTNSEGNLRSCIGYESNTNNDDWDFTRHERVIINSIKVYFQDTNWTAAVDGVTSDNINDTKINFNYGSVASTETAVGWAGRIFKAGVSSVNIFNEESNLNVSDFSIGSNTATSAETEESNINEGEAPNVDIYVGYNVINDDYKKELKYYLKDTESDIWYLQFYIDIEKNKVYSTTSNFSASGINDTANKCFKFSIPRSKMLNFNEIDSYEAETLIPQELAEKSIEELVCDYKAAVVANNRLYVGNIRQNSIIYPDRMIKSPIGKYNILPSSNFIDVAINDGDEITALEYYKDRILQFKNKKVFAINVSGDFEFLEDTFDNVGISKPCQVTKTPFGIVWANKQGCFVYDGQKLTNLIEGKLGTESFQSAITNNYWYVGDSPNIAYVQKTKKLIITSDSEDWPITARVDGYIYDFTSQAWTFTHKQFAANAQPTSTLSQSGNYSNFVKDNNGDILYFVNTAGTDSIMKWSDSSSVHTIANRDVFYFITKDYTFSGPSIRKKIYKVYVTFKAAAAISGTITDADCSGTTITFTTSAAHNLTTGDTVSISGTTNFNDDNLASQSVTVTGATTFTMTRSSSDSNTNETGTFTALFVNTNIKAYYSTNGADGTFTEFSNTASTNYGANGLTDSGATNKWITAELKPSSSINNVYSFCLKFEGPGVSIPSTFQINDFSIVYREKRPK